MKKYLFVAIIAVLTFGCSEKKVVESTYENGNPRDVKYYIKKSGELILDREVVYYENKQKKMEGGYKEMQRNGPWKAWYENGTIWSKGDYKDGKRNGLGIAYHTNGKKYIEGNYLDDVRVGAWRFYDTAGVLLKEVNFDLVPKAQDGDSLK